MSIYCNSDFTQNFTLRGKQNAVVVLPVGTTIEIVLVHVNSGDRFVCNTANGRVVILSLPLGRFSLQLPATYTNTLPVGEYNLDCHRTDNQRTLLFRGLTKVEPAL